MLDAVWAVVVTRVGPGSKSRLAATLDATERRRLTLAMLADVLDVLAEAAADADLLRGIVAVVDDPAARVLAEAAGALVLDDAAHGDMNAAVRAGVRLAARHAATTVIVLPGDIPLISRRDLQALLGSAGEAPRAVVVGASRDGQGTNALLLRPPDVMAPAFGPPSVDRHLRAGLARAAAVHLRPALDLALDVDTPADLALLAEGRHDLRTVRVAADLLACGATSTPGR
ncbi:MAG TPA: 2-phospho-L-lactate guanylyltransferase [Chloroflexota bacterium]